MSTFQGDPIVIAPDGFSLHTAWRECTDYVTRMREAGREVAASFGADPGICSCPMCGASYWAWGLAQRCKVCQFEYPTDWWTMYAWGVAAANPPAWVRKSSSCQAEHRKRLAHPFYRYGFEHPVEDPWEERGRIDWRSVLATGGATP
jgi:hypothetical protein